MPEHDRLEAGALNMVESMTMGVAGTAPAFSVAATTAALIASVGVLSPASLLYCGVIMFGVTLAYMHLNRVSPNAGAGYVWVGAEFGPLLGFLTGWAVLVSSAAFMVSGTIPAATATLSLIAPAQVANPEAVTLVAAAWMVAIGAIVLKGIKPTSYVQLLMTGIEVGVLVLIAVLAIVKFGIHGAHPFSLHWFAPSSFTPSLFAAGALTALYFFWGWDVTVNLNEETKNAESAPGYGAFWSMIVVVALFVLCTVAALLALNDDEIRKSGTNIVLAIAEKLFPKPWSYMAVIAVMLSSIGTLETSILQFTRTMFAQARDGSLARRYARLHPQWKTPWLATALIIVIGLVLLFMSSRFPSVDIVVKDSIEALGFQASFYYSLVGAACAWRFRREAFQSASNFILYFFWPLVSTGFLVFTALYSLPTFDLTTNIVGIGGIALGIVPYMVNRRRRASP
ncbi:MAG: APC family permease [Alphaproteobacteria bacterium]|nr:APC family permease [Alphaproteobacteria bacterium]